MDKTANDTVAANIRTLRKGHGWTVAQLAERCARLGAEELTAAAITNIELRRRGREVTISELIVIADALMVSPSRLLSALADRHVYDALDAINGTMDATISDLERTAANLRAAMAKVTGRSSQRELDSQ